MSNKKQPDQQRQPQAEEEKILSLDEIKEMTVGQVVRKQQDIKDGVEEDDNILDRYIKQHREDIEAEKFETLANAPAISDEMLEETRVALQPAEMAQITAATEEQADADLQIHKVQTSEPVEVDDVPPIAPMTDFEDEYEDDLSDSEKSGKKKMLIWLGLTASFVAILATAFLWMNNMNGGGQASSSSSSSKKTSSSSTDANVAAFEEL